MDPVQFGRFLSEERKANGMTQKDLAEKLGVSDKAVSKWERGICLPDVTKYDDIAEALGITDLEVLRAHRIPEPEAPPPPDRLLTRKHVGWLLLGWLGVAVVCFIGILFEIRGTVQFIGLFNLLQLILATLFGVWFGWKQDRVQRLSLHSVYLGCIGIAVLIGLVLIEAEHHLSWRLMETFLWTVTPGDGEAGIWVKAQPMLLGPELWPPKLLFVKFVCYGQLDWSAPVSLYLELIGFLLVRLLRAYLSSRKRKHAEKTSLSEV